MASNTLVDGGDDAPNYQLRGVEQVLPNSGTKRYIPDSPSSLTPAEDAPNYQLRGVEQVLPNSGTKRYIPDSPSSLTPAEGMLFDTVDDAYNFYKTYAEAGGWTEGQKEFRPVDTLVEQPSDRWVRRVPSKRTGCQAAVRIKLTDAKKYLLYHFTEVHNHDFVHEEDLHLLKENRGINHAHEEMINKMSHLNIGPVRAFNIMKEVYGGFDKVGATKVDFKNFKKELNLFIGEFDAEMFVKRLMRKKEFLPNFSCEYETTDEGVLKCIFWADEDMKRTYYMFGDVISFDATYKCNKYNMMFVPFTGIDNHNRNVTLGAAILSSETAETYSWLLKAIKNAYGYAPPVIVTDQDPAMKKAIADVWPESRHRLCMWHIMDKLTTKVGTALCSNTDFRKRLSAVVWTDSLFPEAFETEWAAILNDFGLTDHEWLTYIYGLRESWNPAYYREEEMSGLMRTSSRSESVNHFFGKISNPKCTLVEFLSHFDTAIEAQRHEHRKNDHDTRYTNPGEWSDFVLENVKLEHVGDFIKFFFIKDLDQPCSSFFEVMIREEDVTVKCNCNRFEQFGLLCSHIFCVLRILDVREFPKQYILRRWTREAVPNSSPGSILTDGGDPDRSEEVNRCVREISHATEYVVNKLISKFDQLSDFRDHIKQFMSVADEAQINAPPKTRRNRFAELLGVAPESTTTIRVPVSTRFKGCGSHKRLKYQKERAISQSGSKRRQCSLCKKYGHNRVTCWKYNVAVPEAGASRNAEGNEDTIGEGDAATVVEGDGPGSNDADDVFYTFGNDADMDDEDMAE
ncbi:protein FAR1-RELATED SEQUENCE 5-like [Helianthus annuus]|uniref:protein FAR1-RELATED SEQUENCE 5-like n=1 Tax=Helianthus annuus TaxID=4232 RepID=UPI000B8FA212|nr:protein FAR1-RELATED SEQUENCE 5-like [Helianthus annuus]